MTQAMPAYVIEYLEAAEDEEDLVMTDISRGQDSTRDKRQLEKWKQDLRIELIREQYRARKKQGAADKPVLRRLLDFTHNR